MNYNIFIKNKIAKILSQIAVGHISYWRTWDSKRIKKISKKATDLDDFRFSLRLKIKKIYSQKERYLNNKNPIKIHLCKSTGQLSLLYKIGDNFLHSPIFDCFDLSLYSQSDDPLFIRGIIIKELALYGASPHRKVWRKKTINLLKKIKNLPIEKWDSKNPQNPIDETIGKKLMLKAEEILKLSEIDKTRVSEGIENLKEWIEMKNEETEEYDYCA